jgi:hypothetical protein
VKPDSGESSQPDWLTLRTSRRLGVCFSPYAGAFLDAAAHRHNACLTRPVIPSGGRLPGLRGRSRGWMLVDVTLYQQE